MNPQLIKYSRETDTSIALARRENRKRLFSIYPYIPHAKPLVGQSADNVDPYKEQFGHRILVKCESLKFRLLAPIDQVEPYYTVLSLFDARNGRKLTENFHFDINHEIVRDMAREFSPAGITTETEDITLPGELKNIPSDWIKYPKQVRLL